MQLTTITTSFLPSTKINIYENADMKFEQNKYICEVKPRMNINPY